jgi:hypothetical protein
MYFEFYITQTMNVTSPFRYTDPICYALDSIGAITNTFISHAMQDFLPFKSPDHHVLREELGYLEIEIELGYIEICGCFRSSAGTEPP